VALVALGILQIPGYGFNRPFDDLEVIPIAGVEDPAELLVVTVVVRGMQNATDFELRAARVGPVAEIGFRTESRSNRCTRGELFR
jgi:hypothetical protein